MTPDDIITFWQAAGPERWFVADPVFDAVVRNRFQTSWQAARDGKLQHWTTSANGLLALIILLDQFPRNMFRGDAAAFSTDAMARELTRRSIANGYDMQIAPDLRAFVYMPLMHSEDSGDQMRCVELFDRLGDQEHQHYAAIHADIIRRFGRFPHRNTVLRRTMTDAEASFLAEGGFSG